MRSIIILQNYFNVLFDANFGINFVLYCVSGQNFRRALFGMCGLRSRRTDTTMMTGRPTLHLEPRQLKALKAENLFNSQQCTVRVPTVWNKSSSLIRAARGAGRSG